MNEIIRVGVIGTGKHGSRYVNHIINDLGGRLELVAISRRSPEGEEQARHWQCHCFHDWRELVGSEQVDAVIAVTTPNLNREIALHCADAKKPLLIEKPLTTDYRDGAEIVARFAEEGLGLTVGQTLRYNSVILELREQFHTMGQLYSFNASQRLEPSTHPWLEKPEVAGGGVIFHTAVHMFDAIRFITGAEFVRIRGSARTVHNRNLEDLLMVEMELDNGAIGILDASKVGPARAGRYEFVCENGQLQGDQVHGILQHVELAKIQELEVIPPGPTISPLLLDWYQFLVGSGKNPIPGEEGLAAVKICHACRAAVESGDWVESSSV